MATKTKVQSGQLAKAGFLLGVALVIVGASGELAIQSNLLQAQPWIESLLFDMELVGIPLFVLSPFVFGIALPLIRG